jgi:hypothetical protein
MLRNMVGGHQPLALLIEQLQAGFQDPITGFHCDFPLAPWRPSAQMTNLDLTA